MAYRKQIVGKLAVASLLIGYLSALLALALKHLTEHYEDILFALTETNRFYLLLFPVLGLSTIYFLRTYLFKGKANKGIREIYDSIRTGRNMPAYKVPSHFVNGFLTVIFGGSTGIEVSTVVASAAIGSVAQQKQSIFRLYKTELISAGVAAGVAALFNSPAAGLLFALEVIAKKPSKLFFLTTLLAVAVAFGMTWLLQETPLFALDISIWHWHAVPWFLVLGVLAALHSVYLTKSVLFLKSTFAKIPTQTLRVLLGAGLLSAALLLLPQLYGDGYHAVTALLFPEKPIAWTPTLALATVAVIVLKPLLTSVTLAAGGDGGVFAPSLFLGAFLGFGLATVLNTFLDAHVIPLNFMVIGMAAVLSASIHAPFTALFLVCGLTNDYTLFFPILTICLVSKFVAKWIFPFTVYSIPQTIR
ncbi:chloride channel protein [Flavobacterium caeni]|uniref:Chloride channel protein, CIC family n=1 Tax=Flavobacterium caeni TaxID=490189 RepID=A0A1G5AQH0_9FLAO|nr:chloride channel protein [Flavobacterium caeni]SCX80121.1 chloride channel protein, CIC family [Flavobacterium caeni]